MYWLAAQIVALMAVVPLQDIRAAGPLNPDRLNPDLLNPGPLNPDLLKVRQAGVAGSFYPADPKVLSATIDGLLAHASPPPISDPILAVVAPHAGYAYSGAVAAYTYAALKGRKYARVVVIAPSHLEGFGFTSVYDGDAYETPLGAVQVDKAFARQLVKMNSTIRLSSQGHDPTSAGAEHSIEAQLPWLQRVLGDFELVPVIMGDQSYESSRALGAALEKLIKPGSKPGSKTDVKTGEGGGETLIVASSDLSHYHPYDEAVKMDRKTLHALEEWDYFSMSRNFQTRVWEACGGAPIVAAMSAAERLGANQALVLKYANSGDVTGDRSRVVGYSADVFVKMGGLRAQSGKAALTPFSLSEQEKNELLALARASVEHAVEKKEAYEPPVSRSEALNQERGAFVTLRKSGGQAGELRGCVGYTSATKPLYRTVRDTATLAALRDPRFQPVTVSELPQLEYEISVLSPLRRVLNLEQIKIGEHGLLMKNGASEGLLLPQVPVEQKWDREKFLEQTCVKTGMNAGCWKDEDTDIFLFTAVVFGEHKPQAPTSGNSSPDILKFDPSGRPFDDLVD
jgi:AmmeMemoRadiSam system protein B/AmmeMemoRadiSam system protein A